MSFYRTLMATVAALGLATSVFAADDATPAASTDSTTQTTTTEMTTTAQAAPEAVTQVNVNTATAEELAKVKGLNAAKAAKIVKYRDANGNFSSLDDLKKVKGLGLNARQMKIVKKALTV